MKQNTILIQAITVLVLWGLVIEYAHSMFIYAPVPYADESGYPNEVYNKPHREVEEQQDSTLIIQLPFTTDKGTYKLLTNTEQQSRKEGTDSLLIPNDPLFNNLWGLHNTGQTGGSVDMDIDAPEAWAMIEAEGVKDSVVVGVIDTGVDYGHEDLVSNIWNNLAEDIDGDGHTLEFNESTQSWELDPGDLNGIDDDNNGYIDDLIGWDFVNDDNDPMDSHGHGTHVSGTIAATANNDIGIAGVCWSAQIMALRVFEGADGAATLDVIRSIEYAIDNGAKVINNSWGIPQDVPELYPNFDFTLRNVLSQADALGILFVASAGNSGKNTDITPNYPSGYAHPDFNIPNILSVAATDRHDQLASFTGGRSSSFGFETVNIAAPGHSILSTLPNDIYASWSGTSMVAPQVSAAAAAIWSVYPALTHLEVKAKILNGVDEVLALKDKVKSHGRLNLAKALVASIGLKNKTTCLQANDSFDLMQTWTDFTLQNGVFSIQDPLFTINDNQLLYDSAMVSSTVELPYEVRVWYTATDHEGGMLIDSTTITFVDCTELAGVELTCAEYRVRDSLALVALYHATEGENWAVDTGWLTAPLEQWHGITLSEGDCQRVEEIDLSGNGLKGALPDSIGFLTAVWRLELNGLASTTSGITIIPSTIGQLKLLQVLDIDSNNISEIPVELGQLSNLKELSLDNNNISEIPIELGQLSQLEKLWLYENHISEIPITLGQLSNLQELSLSRNDILEIPIALGQLSQLERLWLYENNISEIPIELGGLKNLQLLNLARNFISEIPRALGDLSNLQLLSLSRNFISEIPRALGNLSSLQELYLYSNAISEIPVELRQLNNLQILSLGSNAISEIPVELGQLDSLEVLYLSANNIREIPLELSQLNNLQHLLIDTNQLTYTIENFVNTFKNSTIFNYAPQDTLPLLQSNNTLFVSAGGTPSNNTYYWYQEGELIDIISEDSTYTPTESGTYHCQITNKIVTDSTSMDKMLILTTESKRVNITENICPAIPISLLPLTTTNNVALLPQPISTPTFCAQANISIAATTSPESSDSAQVLIAVTDNTIVQVIEMTGGETTFPAATFSTGQYQLFALQYQIEEFTFPNIGDSLNSLADCVAMEAIPQQDFIILSPIQIHLEGIQFYVNDTDFSILIRITGGRPAWDKEGSYQINYINSTIGSTGVIYENGFAYATIDASTYGFTLGETLPISVSNDGALCESITNLVLFIDQDQDGIPEGEDCNDTNANIGGEGSSCSLPNGDMGIYDSACNCVTLCASFGGDTDGDGVCDEVDCAINDPLLGDFCYCAEEAINACPLTLSVRKRCVLANNTYEVIVGWSGHCIDSTAQLLVNNVLDTLHWVDIAQTAQDSIVLVYPATQDKFEVIFSSLNLGCEQTLGGRSPCNIEFCDITYLSLVNSVCAADGDAYALTYSWTGGPYPAFSISDLTGQGVIDTNSLQNPQMDSTGIFTVTYPITTNYELEFTDQDFAFCIDVEAGNPPTCACKATLGLEEYIYYYCSDSVATPSIRFPVTSFDGVFDDALWGWTLIYCSANFVSARSKNIDLLELLRTGEEGIDWKTLPNNYILGTETGIREMTVGPFSNHTCSEKVWNAALVAARFEPNVTGGHTMVELDTNCFVNTTHLIFPRTHTEIIQTGTCDIPPSVQIQAVDGTICEAKQSETVCSPLEYQFGFHHFFRQPKIIRFLDHNLCLQDFRRTVSTDCDCTCDVESNFKIEKDTICIHEGISALNTATGTIDRCIWKKDGQTMTIAGGSVSAEFEFDTVGSHKLELISQRIINGDTICMDNYQQTIWVKDSLTEPTFMATVMDENHQMVQFDIIVPISGVNYTWDFGGTGVKDSEVASGFSYTYDEFGTYTITLTASDECNSIFSTKTVTVVEFPPSDDCNWAVTLMEDDQTICEGTTMTFHIQEPDPIIHYNWSINDIVVGNRASDYTVTFPNQSPLYILQVTGIKEGCVSVSDSIDIKVLANNSSSLDFDYESKGKYTISFMVNNSSNNNVPLTYKWDFGDGKTSAQQHPTHRYAVVGMHEVCLTVKEGEAACTRVVCQMVRVE